MRKRFNSKRICSFENYESSLRAHHNDLVRNHNTKTVVEYSKTIVVKKRYFTTVFGKVVNIKEAELSYYEGFKIYTY